MKKFLKKNEEFMSGQNMTEDSTEIRRGSTSKSEGRG